MEWYEILTALLIGGVLGVGHNSIVPVLKEAKKMREANDINKGESDDRYCEDCVHCTKNDCGILNRCLKYQNKGGLRTKGTLTYWARTEGDMCGRDALGWEVHPQIPKEKIGRYRKVLN